MSDAPKIAVAMSGGVDSTFTVKLLQNEGYTVIGVTMVLLPDYVDSKGEKCYKDIRPKVTAVAENLGIEHYFLDVRAAFMDEVLRPSWDVMCHGLTPNPCALCNPRIKFGRLIPFAESLGASALATGHYANLRKLPNGDVGLFRAVDDTKDQTYFLFGLSQAQLRKIRMPLGEFNKAEVKQRASSVDFEIAHQRESQDACFSSPNEPFGETLRNLFKSHSKRGFFIAPDGKKLTRHDGIHAYTIGQRKGLRVALGVPAYVSRIDPESGDVFLAVDESELMTSHLYADVPSWQGSEPPELPLECDVQVRYRSNPVRAVVHAIENGIRVDFAEPQRAITPGQAVVFYRAYQMLGGSWIRSFPQD